MEGLKKICGFITILTSIAALITATVVLFTEARRSEQFIVTFGGILISISVFYFTYTTKFWNTNTKSKPIIDLDNELEIIKKQIEKKELLNKLDLLEKK